MCPPACWSRSSSQAMRAPFPPSARRPSGGICVPEFWMSEPLGIRNATYARPDAAAATMGRDRTFDPAAHLPDDLLERFRERAAVHDRENTFPDDDLAELKAAGYLAILVPAELGGGGLGLAEASVLQQRLAGAAPATALAINMHLVWTGRRQGARRSRHRRAALRAGGRGRRRGVRLRHQRGRQRPRAVRQRHGCRAPAGRRLRVHRHEDLHLARPGVDAARACTASTRRRADAPKLVYAFVPRTGCAS